jgi:hydroxyacylglutathione hydrolase
MLFEKIESPGLAHYSYLIGDRTHAVVIDPRRDVDVYISLAEKAGCSITHIFETHRHEDFVLGSVELSSRTGAPIWHADAELPYAYGAPAREGQEWPVGRLKLKALLTPGHTPGGVSYVLFDPDGNPWTVFSGDTLFAGDVGRVDLLGEDRMPDLAEQLYESIFYKLLPLGDGVMLCPAHGAGSVCGETIAERAWTTLGLERQYNPMLITGDKAAFVEKASKMLERPPYFRSMERYNVEGAPAWPLSRQLKALTPRDVAAGIEKGGMVLDTRSELAFGSAHVPGALSIWQGGISSFAGWYIPHGTPLYLVCEDGQSLSSATLLSRIGLHEIRGYLGPGMLGWHMSGKNSAHVEMRTVQTLCHMLDHEGKQSVLDVRSVEEREMQGSIPGALERPVTALPEKYQDIPKEGDLYIFCGSGLRSMMAASFLKRKGWDNTVVVLGGISGWNSISCPLDQPYIM